MEATNLRISQHSGNDYNLLASRLSISFKEKITISQDQYSYTWLNFWAEVGGYIGLFLGISLFHAADAVDFLIRKIWMFIRSYFNI